MKIFYVEARYPLSSTIETNYGNRRTVGEFSEENGERSGKRSAANHKESGDQDSVQVDGRDERRRENSRVRARGRDGYEDMVRGVVGVTVVGACQRKVKM